MLNVKLFINQKAKEQSGSAWAYEFQTDLQAFLINEYSTSGLTKSLLLRTKPHIFKGLYEFFKGNFIRNKTHRRQ